MFASIAGGRRVPGNVVDKRIELSVVTERRSVSSPNVLAVLEGSDPTLKNEYIVIGAHHDHLGMRNGRPLNGADDDGSGTVAMLEIAQALSLNKPKRSVILAWFTGEEKGLLGSHYFVNNCPVPLDKISANLNLDMISRNDPNSLYLIASNNLSTELDQAILGMNDKHFKMKFDYEYNDRTHQARFYYRSDHYPFIRVGIPAVWLFCGTTPDYHQLTDTIDRVDFAKMEKVTRLTYLVTLQIGNKPELLKLDANPEVKTRGKHNTSVESIR
jgi:Zn-dependent M28 family amino/carboxypeptidase